MMDRKGDVIDLADDDDEEGAEYDLIPPPDDIEEDIEYAAGPSRRISNGAQRIEDGAQIERNGIDARQELKEALARLDAELHGVDSQIAVLQKLRGELVVERRQVEHDLVAQGRKGKTTMSDSLRGSTSDRSSKGIDYLTADFPWSGPVKKVMKRVFAIDRFRLCQEGVVNAALDDRDIVCVMPTGGGKSLTYQLPAIIGTKGLTVVISPLLALIWDQVRALKSLGIECVMLTGSTSKEEQNDAYRRMEQGPATGVAEIRMCYVTPEKIAKSKRFMSILQKVNANGRFTRFVIDEAHCCSQLGHDFRPDYKKLNVLKTLFPRVPIQAVTATLSSKTLPDLLKILRMPPICDGRAANPTGTIFFSAPLYRPNLHYQVQVKPANGKAAIEKIGSWIKDNHLNESGIIYCLSKKDAETVADELSAWSGGQIKTGVYHAGVTDHEKERIHVKWRAGKVNCICATIAFGLGIDKGDVRYVIHHSMSKSLDGYYQETGRAGRDGKDSDCILFYRGQDASRLSSLIFGDMEGTSKLHEMLKFAQDLTTCRKIAFARYFSTSAQLSTNAWDHADSLSTSGTGSVVACGNCDNCRRDPTTIISRIVTLDTWRILRVIKQVEQDGGRVTLSNVADLARGLAGGTYAIPDDGGGSRKRKPAAPTKGSLSVAALTGGKVTLNKEDTEALIIHLILMGYLQDDFQTTAYAVNVYVVSGPKAPRLCRFSQAEIEAGSIAPIIEYTFPAPKGRKGKKKSTADDDDADEPEGDEADGKPAIKKEKAAKRKAIGNDKQGRKKLDLEKDIALGSDEDEGDSDMDIPDYMEDDDMIGEAPSTDGLLPSSDPPEAEWAVTQPARKTRVPKKSVRSEEVVEVSD